MAIDAVLVGSRGSSGASPINTVAGTTTASGSTFAIALAFGSDVNSNTPTDSKSNTYTKRGSTISGLPRIEWWVCENGTGGANHSAQATFSGAPNGSAYLIEITGAATASVDQTGGGADGTDPHEVTLGTLAQADELILSLISTSLGSPTYASTNGTLLDQEQDGGLYWTSAVAKRIVSSTTGPTVGFTGGNSDAIVAAVSFKQASAGGVSITPSVGALVLTGIAATVAATGSVTRTPTVGALTLTGVAPTALVSGAHARTPLVGSLTFTGQQPTMTLTVAAPVTGALTLSGVAPTLLRGTVVSASVGSLSISGIAPTVTQSGPVNTTIMVSTGSMTLTGNAATLIQSSPLIRPSTGSLTFTGNAPGAVSQASTIVGGSRSVVPLIIFGVR